jgi:Outer membrane efflux protein
MCVPRKPISTPQAPWSVWQSQIDPLFNLTGNIGQTSSHFNNLVSPVPPFLFWTIAGSVTQTVFDGFTLEQRQRAAVAGWDQAATQYQSTLVTTFQNVADVLQAIDFDTKSVQSAKQAAAAARTSLCLHVAAFVGYYGETKPGAATLVFAKSGQKEVQKHFGDWWKRVCVRYDLLKTQLQAQRPNCMEPNASEVSKECKATADRPSGIDVLTAEQVDLATRLSLRIAEATRYADVVALFQALGGGWWNRQDVAGPGP